MSNSSSRLGDRDGDAREVVQVKRLSIRYGDIVAVQDVSFTVTEGELFGLIGPNGAGKTSIVESVVGLRPSALVEGTIRTCGLNPVTDQKKLKELVGVQLQESAFPSRTTVGEICALYESIYGRRGATSPLLEEFGLLDRRTSLISALSGGLRQRLSLVLAQVGTARLIVLDELTTGLDPEQRRATWKSVQRLATSGTTILLTSHYMDEIEALCSRVGVLVKGQLVHLGKPAELIAKYGGDPLIVLNTSTLDDATVQRLSLASNSSNLKRTDSSLSLPASSAGTIERLLAILANEKLPQSILQVRTPTLEDAYLNLIESKEPMEAQYGV